MGTTENEVEDMSMKKTLTAALVLISVVAQAPLKNQQSLTGVGVNLKTALGLQAAFPLAKASMAKKASTNQQAFLPTNPYQSYFDQNPYAKTELKIDLDNFEMEYVLKVQ